MKQRAVYDPLEWQDNFEVINIVLNRIVEIYAEDIDNGEIPNYKRFLRQKELFGASLSYKNLNGDQILTIFTKKFFSNRKMFKKLI